MGRICFLVLFAIIHTAVPNGASVVDFHAKRAAYIEESARLVNSYINNSVDPCTDYTSYICNGNKVMSEMTLDEMTRNRLMDSNRVKNFFQEHEEDIKSIITTNEVKMKDFFKSCKNQNPKKFGDVLKENTFLSIFKTWPIFDSNWHVEKFDIVQLLGELASYYFNIGLDVGIKNTFKENVLRIKPAAIYNSFLDAESSKRREEMLTSVGIDNFDSVIADIAAFFKEFSEVVPDDDENKSPELKITYGHFKKDFPNFDWDRYFRILSDTVPDDSLDILIVNPERIKAAIATIENMEPRKVVNFIFVELVSRFYHVQDNKQFPCYYYAFIIFKPIISQILVDKHFNKEFVENFMGAMDILLETIDNDLHLLQMPHDTAMEKLDKIINEEFLPSLTSAENNKRLKEWNVDPYYSFYANAISFFPTMVKDEMQNSFKTHKTHKILSVNFISYLITNCLFDFEKQPAALQYDSIAAPVIIEAKHLFNKADAEELEDISERVKEQFNATSNMSIFAPDFLQSSQYYLELYQKWAQKNQDVIQQEDELLSAYGLNSMKVLFSAMRDVCPWHSFLTDREKKIIEKQLSNSNAFVREYNCASGDAINKNDISLGGSAWYDRNN